MPLDDLGCTRTTILLRKHVILLRKRNEPSNSLFGLKYCKCLHEIGISCKCELSFHIENVPVFCTHRPSLESEEFHFSNISCILHLCGDTHEIA